MNARLSFDAELESLSASLIRMGALATDAIDKAIEALEANDGALAQSVIAGDRNIDDMERSIEHQCLTLLLRQQPVAGDLRKISTAIKMITDIERIGDAAADIAEITTHIKEHGIPASLSDIADMAEAAQKMVDDSIQSYVREDLVLAADVIARDDVVDDYFNKIKKDLAAYIAVNEELRHRLPDDRQISGAFGRPCGEHLRMGAVLQNRHAQKRTHPVRLRKTAKALPGILREEI